MHAARGLRTEEVWPSETSSTWITWSGWTAARRRCSMASAVIRGAAVAAPSMASSWASRARADGRATG